MIRHLIPTMQFRLQEIEKQLSDLYIRTGTVVSWRKRLKLMVASTFLIV